MPNYSKLFKNINIFNSLGSNYNFKYALDALFIPNKQTYRTALKNLLAKKYGGEVFLIYKGREAIELALSMSRLPKNASVAITGFTCLAVYQAIINAGYMPELLDIEKASLNFSAETLENKLKANPAIRAVIIQNTLGYLCDIQGISQICQKYHCLLIEDLAHSVGTRYANGAIAGGVGDYVVFSFSQDKIVDAVTGGVLITRCQTSLKKNTLPTLNDVFWPEKLKNRCYPLFTWIIRKTYKIGVGKFLHTLLKTLNLLSSPFNTSSSEKFHHLPLWSCKIITDNFHRLENNLRHRKKIASIYHQVLPAKILLSKTIQNLDRSTNLRFPIIVEKRHELISYLKKHGVHVADIWYDAVISPKRYMNNVVNHCPNGEKTTMHILNLPTHRNIATDDARQIARLINLWWQSQLLK